MSKQSQYSFSVETSWTIFSKYTSHVRIYRDCIKIKRVGRVGDIPEEVTIPFDSITSITYTKDSNYMLSYIAFTGLSNSTSQSINGLNMGKMMVASSSANPWSDPYGIVFKLKMYETVEPYYKKMVEVFEAYKREQSGPKRQNIIVNDSSVDKLKKLKELKDLGIITSAEYEKKREKLLSEI